MNKIDYGAIWGPSEKVRLEKKQEGWLISEPVKTQVNLEKVGNFLKQLHEVSPKKEVRHLEPGVTTGLEEPQSVIQGYSGPKDQVFDQVGSNSNKSEQTVYASFARSEGPTLRYALPRLMVFRLGLGLSDLRERRIWAQANSPNTKIRYQRLSRGNAGFTFEAIKNAKVLSHRR